MKTTTSGFGSPKSPLSPGGNGSPTGGSSDENSGYEDRLRRLMRRMEHCTRAREESTRLLSLRFAQRDAVRAQLRRGQEELISRVAEHKQRTSQRWSLKLQDSPYTQDLAGESVQVLEVQRVRQLVENRKKQLIVERREDSETALIQRVLATRDDSAHLRADKRREVEFNKQKKARDRMACKTLKNELISRNSELDREQASLQKKLRGGN